MANEPTLREPEPWTPADDVKLASLKSQLADLECRRNASISNVQSALLRFFDKNCKSHTYSIRELVQLVCTYRFQLLDILSEGEYSNVMARRMHVEEQQDDDGGAGSDQK